TPSRKERWARSCCRRSRAQSSTRDRGGGHAGQRGELPAGAGNVLRREVDLLGEAHQLPVAGAVAEQVAGLLCQREHGLIGAQGVAEQFCGAKGRSAAFEILQKRRADAMALPSIVDQQSELETRCLEIEGVARLADDGLES